MKIDPGILITIMITISRNMDNRQNACPLSKWKK